MTLPLPSFRSLTQPSHSGCAAKRLFGATDAVMATIMLELLPGHITSVTPRDDPV